ncbi:hypothetical protein [Arthrobacter sp. StoSoilB5]|uniref:hypothetical protein n=1 Tax=Arthrobacter sp. StoSoilB5 TaxID=2830992 RepID=UPI0021E1961F|nr:hypothetical protein [Arthrobacter sp. StoSoilB5]
MVKPIRRFPGQLCDVLATPRLPPLRRTVPSRLGTKFGVSLPLEGLPDLEDSFYLDSFASFMLVLEVCKRCQGFLQAPEPDEPDRGEFSIGIGVEMFHVEDDLVKLTNRRRGCFPVAGFYEDTGCMDDADTAFEGATIESPELGVGVGRERCFSRVTNEVVQDFQELGDNLR